MKSISDVFSRDGDLSGLLKGFQYRPEQESMALAIYDAIEQGQDLICEAGTGTGKTMAYLVPALLSEKKTIVSTGTKHLQDQLKQKDLPVILDVLRHPVTIMVLKGRANYVCLKRMQTARDEPGDLTYQQMTDLHEVVQWSSSTTSGDINELPMMEDNSTLRTLVTSTTENCLGQSCSEYDKCFVFKNRKAAMEADLVITNHHLLLADMGLRESGFGEVLPLADTIIFDEAHQLPELASTYFSQALSSRQLLELVSDIRLADREEAGDIDKLEQLLVRMEKNVRDVRLVFGRQDRRSGWQELWDNTALSTEMPLMLEQLQELVDALEQVKQRGKLLENCWQRCRLHYDFIEKYISSGSDSLIRWVEVRGLHFYLNQTPVNIAETFQQRLNTYNASSIFTSASLAVNNDFTHFKNQLGLADCDTRVWDSPFDYAKQTALYIPTDLPEPNDRAFFDRFIERTIALLKLSDGHAFVLFTSHQALNRAAKRLAEEIDYPTFIQGRASRSEMLNRFRQTRNAVLLGTNSFWEGVDVKGEALSLVIIDKLPFASPDDPVLQARLNYLAKQGGKPFMEYQVPQAAIVLKQGVGRLIRDINDSGVCVICDKRIVSKSYGKRLLNSLPAMPVTHQLQDIADFFRNRSLIQAPEEIYK
ncbi:MAG: ATP-dependent DNA helicase [Gammaproteobacteria bacterium]